MVLVSLWVACLVWLGLGVGYQILKGLGVELLQVVPEYHFHLYFKSFEAAFAGLGVASLVEWTWRRLVAARRIPPSDAHAAGHSRNALAGARRRLHRHHRLELALTISTAQT